MVFNLEQPVVAAGTFNLNCDYLGIPCVGYNNVNTQKCHPNLSVDVGDVEIKLNFNEKIKRG